jgi:hypothetical protein
VATVHPFRPRRRIRVGARDAAATSRQHHRGTEPVPICARTTRRHDIALAQAIADLVTITILQAVATAKAQQRDEQPQFALGGRVIIEQAKGTLVEHRRMDMPTVFALIRGTPN